MPRRIVLVGACYLDTILTVPRYPKEDDKQRATSISRRRGGNVPNTAEVLQQLLNLDSRNEIKLTMCMVLPSESSQAVEEIKASLDPKVDFSHCVYREDISDAASSYIVKSTATDSRTIVNFNPLEEMTLAEFADKADAIGEEAIWYHFEGRIPEVTLECIRHVKQTCPNARISVEVEKPGRAGLEELAAEADVVFYSKTWAQHNGCDSAEECLNIHGLRSYSGKQLSHSKLLCCTWGSDGAAALKLPERELAQCSAYQLNGCGAVDTIGAGDTFIAGMIFTVLCDERLSLNTRINFANELAGRKVMQDGFKGLGQCMKDQGWTLTIGSSP